MACGAGAEPGERIERGALVLQVPIEATKDSVDVQIANAIELLQSRSLVERVVEQERLERVLGGERQDKAVAVHTIQQAVRASRRGDSSVIEVGMAFAASVDPVAAVDACNRLMQAFVEHRMHARMAELQSRRAVLASELEPLVRSGSAAAGTLDELQQRLLEVDRERMQRTNDVLLLDPCRMRGKPRT